MDSMIDTNRGCSYFNCEGFIDDDASADGCSAQNQTYDSTKNTKDMSCIAADVFLPLLILSLLAGLVGMMVSGRMGTQPQEPYGSAY